MARITTFGRLRSLFTAVILLLLDADAYPVWSHGWDTLAGQLAVNVGSWNSALNTTGLWEWIAGHYAAVAMNDWFNRYSGPPGTDPKITAARTLKALNPGIKLLWYQAADFVSQSAYVTGQIMTHPEWWLRDDANATILFQGVPELDWSIPAARQWCVVALGASLHCPPSPIIGPALACVRRRQVHSPPGRRPALGCRGGGAGGWPLR